ncbi:MAG: DEAD/DEAH box helicase [Phycisphaerae bacterium]|nr:DEAD/DEAH box helicase [Phycisphaerae bacterium]
MRKRKSQGSETSSETSSETPPVATHDTDWSLDEFEVPEDPDLTRFHDLGLPDAIMHAIADLGFQYCTPIQAMTLKHIHSGHNIAGRAQTGTGKTAAFLIAAFSRFLKKPMAPEGRPLGTPRALVLAPTRELVIQIEDDAAKLGKYCRFNSMAVYGGMHAGQQRTQLLERPVDLIVATPGRLLDFMQQRLIHLDQVETLIIDEADRMLDMGFIPDVKRIISRTPPKHKRRTMLYSATLTTDVLRLASQWMPDPMVCEIEPEQVTVDTVDQVIYITRATDKFRILYNLLQRYKEERVLIFCNRRDTTDRLDQRLHRLGIDSEMLSGAVAQKKRLKILSDFKEGKLKVLVATDVAGRGLHVKDIGLVVNYHFPYDPEDYVHRIGRTGRAGVKGTAVSFACDDDSYGIPDIEKYIGRDLPCRMPEEDLLVPIPADKLKAMRAPRPRPAEPREPRSGRGGRGNPPGRRRNRSRGASRGGR